VSKGQREKIGRIREGKQAYMRMDGRRSYVKKDTPKPISPERLDRLKKILRLKAHLEDLKQLRKEYPRNGQPEPPPS